MHYRNGREAKNGDVVIQLAYSSGNIVSLGVLFNATAGNDYYNGSIAPTGAVVAGACICDCLHMEDVMAILKEHGLDKRKAQ